MEKEENCPSMILKKIWKFIVTYRQPIIIALVGIVAGIVSSALNHYGEFWKWGVLAKTASNYGFWIIFVVLIIIKSKTRKLAVLNVFLFCILMCIAYGVMETIYKLPEYYAGDLSANFPYGDGPIGLFLEYELGQVIWFVAIALLVPISMLIFNCIHGKAGKLKKIVMNLLVIVPLVLATVQILAGINNPVVVCADVSNGWLPGNCVIQSPDAWIVINLIIEAALYTAFIIFWLVYQKNRVNRIGTISKNSARCHDSC